MSGKNGTALIKRELHVVDNLIAKALIDINIIKPKAITLDLERDIIRIDTCEGLEVPITIVNRGTLINSAVYNYK